MRALAFALLLGCSAVAVAAPATPGEQLYNAGARAFRKMQWAEARRAFTAAYDLDHKVELLYDIALAVSRQARADGNPQTLREAADAYRRYLAEAPDGRRRKPAEQALTAIDAQLAAAKPETPPPVATPPAEPERAPLDPYADTPANAAPAPARADVAPTQMTLAPTPAAPAPQPDLIAPTNPPPPPRRAWVIPVIVASAVSVLALAVGLGVGLSQSSNGPSLGSVSWVP